MMDNLSRCALEARRMGLHYGDYMAKKRNGALPPAPPFVEPVDPKAIPCRYCGELFVPYHGGVKYCSSQCRRNMENQKQRERQRKKEHGRGGKNWREDTAVCPICGVRFHKSVPHQVYCGTACAEEGNREKARVNRRRQREREAVHSVFLDKGADEKK